VTSVQEGAAPVESFAGGAVSAWSDLIGVLHSSVPAGLLTTARDAVASVLTPASSDLPGSSPAAWVFGQQMVADVASLSEAQRSAALAELGPSAADYAYALYVYDIGARARAAFTRLRGEPVLADQAPRCEGDVRSAQTRFLREVAKLSRLDPLTAEIVRLRGASAHACRLCQSVRSLSAARAAGGLELYDSIPNFEASELSPRHKTALRLVDAFIWQPMTWPEGLAGEVQGHFSPVEAVELVFDLMRNSSNKIAVAFAADAAHVEDGVEFYDIDPATGDLDWGLVFD
jgi:alkylhydroperoxidase family enzyme